MWQSWICRLAVTGAVMGDEEIGGRIGEQGSENAQGKATDEEWNEIRADLLVEGPPAKMIPIEGRDMRRSSKRESSPDRGAKNRNHGPGVIDERASHDRHEVEPKRPGAQNRAERVETVRG